MAHEPNHTQPPRRRSLIVMTACLAACAVGVVATMAIESDDPASAADDPTTTIIPLSSGEQIVITSAGDIAPGVDADIVQSQCVRVGDGSLPGAGEVVCLGGGYSPESVTVTDSAGRRPPGWDRAFGWIVDEAVDVLPALYDVPADGRVAAYGIDEVNAYVHQRLLYIVDKVVFGEELTELEQRAYDYLVDQLSADSAKRADAAYEEHLRFERSPCTYTPPPPPPYIDDPVTVPDDVLDQCADWEASQLAQFFTPVPASPTVSDFQTWGSYAVEDAVGLPTGTQQAIVAGMATASHAAAVAAGTAAAATAAGLGFVLAANSSTVAFVATAALGSVWATKGAVILGMPVAAVTGTLGVAAFAAVVGVVLFALLMIGIWIYSAVDRAKIGQSLKALRDEARGGLDPLGMSDLQAAYSGREFLDYGEDTPDHYEATVGGRILKLVVDGALIEPDGSVRGAPSSLWAPNATDSSDHRFRIVSGTGAGTVVDSIHIAQEDGDLDIRFDQGWMIVGREAEATTAELSFDYESPSGERYNVSRMPPTPDHPDGGFVLMEVDESTWGVGEQSDRLTFFDGTEEVTVELVPPGTLIPGEVYPAAIGLLTTATSVALRPNPVDETGAFNPDAFTSGYDFAWTVERYDPDAETWVTVHTASEYATTFTPSETGSYRAIVTMQEDVAVPQPAVDGRVLFSVTPPEIYVDAIELVDNGFDEAYLDLRLGEEILADTFSISVQWPGLLGSDVPGPVTSTTTPCHGIAGDHLCNGAVDGVFGGPLSFDIPPAADLSQGVDVTISSSYGAEVVRHLTFDSIERPRLVAIDPSNPLVEFGPDLVYVQRVVGPQPWTSFAKVELGSFDDPQLVDLGLVDPDTGSTVPGIEPLGPNGPTVSLSQDASDDWVLSLAGSAGFDQVGVVEVPIVIQQNDTSGRGWTAHRLHIAVVPAPDDQVRAFVDHDPSLVGQAVDIVPTFRPFLLGGKSGATFAGDVCVNLYRTALPPGPEYCGPATEFFAPNGGGLAFPAWELTPTGIPADSPHRAAIRLIDDGSGVASPLSYDVLFRVTNDPPSVDVLSWNDSVSTLTYAASSSDAGIALTDIVCELDGEPFGGCTTPAGGTLDLASLDNGIHDVEIRVHDDRNNFTTRTLSFEVTNGVTTTTSTTSTTTTTSTTSTSTTSTIPDSTTTSTTSTTSTSSTTSSTSSTTTPDDGTTTSTTTTSMPGDDGTTTAPSTVGPTSTVPGSAPFAFVGDPVPGGRVDIVVSSPSIDRGRAYRGILRSTPVQVGPVVATSDGTVTFTGVVLPPDWSDGQHSFTLVDAESGLTTSVVVFDVASGAVEIVSVTDGPSSELPSTGGNASPLRDLGAVLLLFGLALLVLAARRREHDLVTPSDR